jgi:predicted component of type VI protein secretion system
MEALWRISADEPFAATPWALPQTTRGAVAVENLAGARAAIPHTGLVSLGEVAASSPSPAHAATATAGGRTDRDGEAIRQSARLATWEDEGGTTSG